MPKAATKKKPTNKLPPVTNATRKKTPMKLLARKSAKTKAKR